MPIIIRHAVRTEQPIIRAIVRAARLNPLQLHWANFVVAEQDGGIVGVGQVRPHGDGCRELASIAVQPQFQGGGMGGEIVRVLVARTSDPLHLMCAAPMMEFYTRFGFRQVQGGEIPKSLRWKVRLGNLLASMVRHFGGQQTQIIAMRWEQR